MLATPRGRLTVGAALVSLAASGPFMVLEVGTISAYRLGWLNIWNGVDACTYVLQARRRGARASTRAAMRAPQPASTARGARPPQVSITAMHLTRHVASGYLSILCAVQCILLLFRLQYFSRVFTATRFAFLEAVKEAIKAISAYLAFMLLIMFGFAVAFHVLFRMDQEHEEVQDHHQFVPAHVSGLAMGSRWQPS